MKLGKFNIVMELVNGVDYRDVIVARRGYGVPFTEKQIFNWARQLGEALEYLHDTHKIVHEDLHNGNVMITGLDVSNLVKDEEALLKS